VRSVPHAAKHRCSRHSRFFTYTLAISVYLRVMRTLMSIYDEYTGGLTLLTHTRVQLIREHDVWRNAGIHRRRRRVWRVGRWPSTNRNSYVPSYNTFLWRLCLSCDLSSSLPFPRGVTFPLSSWTRYRIKDIARRAHHRPGLLEYWVTLDGASKFLRQNERRDTNAKS